MTLNRRTLTWILDSELFVQGYICSVLDSFVCFLVLYYLYRSNFAALSYIYYLLQTYIFKNLRSNVT